jgi:hypothetical protein
VGVMPRSTKGRAAARGLDARLSLQHASCLLEMLHSKQLRSIKMLLDSNHGIYRKIARCRLLDVTCRNAAIWSRSGGKADIAQISLIDRK